MKPEQPQLRKLDDIKDMPIKEVAKAMHRLVDKDKKRI